MQVYKATQDNVRTVAVKLLNDDKAHTPAEANDFWNEVEVLGDLRDKHILQFYGAAISGVSLMSASA